jgi:hypothetical protein
MRSKAPLYGSMFVISKHYLHVDFQVFKVTVIKRSQFVDQHAFKFRRQVDFFIQGIFSVPCGCKWIHLFV